uniref:Uncharacterized protein n=1 Tax=viral metagenome TaxID=1070528 RepID=A0A6C0JEQ3_9ZZZZ
MGSCYKTSNNKYFNCPPRMDDGRHFTDYRPNCHINNLVRANNAILNSHQYRMFLQHNSNKLMNLNRTYACQKNCCGPCQPEYNQGTMLAEQSVQQCNNRSCNTDFVNKGGLGLGRKYDGDSQQCGNWPKTLPVNQQYNCCADNNALFNYYNQIDSKAQGELVSRNTVPSGGNAMGGGDPAAYNL